MYSCDTPYTGLYLEGNFEVFDPPPGRSALALLVSEGVCRI